MRSPTLTGLLLACATVLVAGQEPPQENTPPGPPTDRVPLISDAAAKNYDEPPRLLKQSRPAYPEKAFRDHIEGKVVVEFTNDEKGKVSNLKVVKSVPELDEAALACIKKWEFAPAMKDGRPVATTFKVACRLQDLRVVDSAIGSPKTGACACSCRSVRGPSCYNSRMACATLARAASDRLEGRCAFRT